MIDDPLLLSVVLLLSFGGWAQWRHAHAPRMKLHDRLWLRMLKDMQLRKEL